MNKVRQILTEKGMTVTQLMRKSGLSMGTCHTAASLADWPEPGTEWATIQSIAKALGVTPEYLISGNNKES